MTDKPIVPKLEGVEKVYLGGPMSGIMDFNFPLFNRVSEKLRSVGYVVINPAETAGGVKHLPRDWYFRFDFAVISTMDAVLLLPEWQDSSGACAEVVYANEIGLPVFELVPDKIDVAAGRFDLRRLDVSGVNVRFHRRGYVHSTGAWT